MGGDVSGNAGVKPIDHSTNHGETAAVADRLLTPTKITAWLDCAHYLTLQHEIDAGLRHRPKRPFGSFAQLLMDKGLFHERACLADYVAKGSTVFTVRDRVDGERFEDWVRRIGNPLVESADYDVVYQMPFAHDGIRGIADFLIRVTDPESGETSWEPVDAKLARREAKPGHVLQLCFYAEAIEALTGRLPEYLHVWLGSGEMESVRTVEMRAYWTRLRALLARVVDEGPSGQPTRPEPCDHCEFCEFADVCDAQWVGEDSLIYVAGLRGAERTALEAAGVSTARQLGTLTVPDGGLGGLWPGRLERLVAQAALQLEAAGLDDSSPPPFRMVEPGSDPTWGRGFERMPEPSAGDVFLDFEGHPFWRADTGLFFLMAFIARDDMGEWQYHPYWAHDVGAEADITRRLIQDLAARRVADPGMHVYHYNHTERSQLTALAEKYGVALTELAGLLESGLFVDLFEVARNAVMVGTPSYGLKHLERLPGFVRHEDIHGGAGAVVEYEAYMGDGLTSRLDHIAAYNEDDVRATLALRDWLVEHRPGDLTWRDAVLDADETPVVLDELVTALHRFDPGSIEHFLGDVMGYWLREWLASKAPTLAKLSGDSDLLDDPTVIAAMTLVGPCDRIGAKDKVLDGMGLEFEFPPQELSDDFAKKPQLYYSPGEGLTGYSSIDQLDLDAGRIAIKWNDRAQELAVIPTAVAINDWVKPDPKHLRLHELGWSVIDSATHGPPNPLAVRLLGRDLPRFVNGGGPPSGTFTDDLDHMKAWVRQLDGSCLAIQGPPGTGKTFRGAHIVHSLVTAGLRVGITAMSHHAIDNLLAEIVDVFRKEGDLARLNAIRKRKKPKSSGLPQVTYKDDNKACGKVEFNVVAGTTWLFANDAMVESPVDVLIIDEAGQLALADALAACSSARNLVLLGDPLQLGQVAQASHPHGSGASVLEHILGDHATISDDRGIFLSETWRMHPDVCRFISEQIYEGRLGSHPSCALQSTTEGTGARWLRAAHSERSTDSVEEAALVATELARLMGAKWVDQAGVDRILRVDDFMVVAPYNDQVRMMRELLDADAQTRGVRVGTVDKFQGQQAAVVFFTMTTSSAADMPRGPSFLFSRNRLNVAISRAKCLAFLVCTEDLLDSRARTVNDIRLISTLCSFVEYSQ